MVCMYILGWVLWRAVNKRYSFRECCVVFCSPPYIRRHTSYGHHGESAVWDEIPSLVAAPGTVHFTRGEVNVKYILGQASLELRPLCYSYGHHGESAVWDEIPSLVAAPGTVHFTRGEVNVKYILGQTSLELWPLCYTRGVLINKCVSFTTVSIYVVHPLYSYFKIYGIYELIKRTIIWGRGGGSSC